MELLLWEVYEVVYKNDLQGVKFRGRLRKFANEQEINLMVENDEEDKNCVRFAVLISQSKKIPIIKKFIKEKIDPDSTIKFIDDFKNPVLSKLKVNDESRYQI